MRATPRYLPFTGSGPVEKVILDAYGDGDTDGDADAEGGNAAARVG